MVKPLGNKKSKRTKLSLKYNIQKRVREHKRRVKKEARKLGIKKGKAKDPGIPNSWPFKAEMLNELERKKEQKEKDLAKRRAEAKAQAKADRDQQQQESREAAQQKETERRKKRAEEARRRQHEALRRALMKSDVILEVLDARDPLGCCCPSLEAWAAESGKRIIFVLTKAELVVPQVLVQWLQVLGQMGPAIATSAEAGREGIRELCVLLGHGGSLGGQASSSPAVSSTTPPATSVAIAGYAGTGKKSLCKAIKREIKGPSKWLNDTVAGLRPDAKDDAARLLHLAARGALVPGKLVNGGVAALDVVKKLLERADQQAIIRRYRLPSFTTAEGFLTSFGKDRKILTRKGKEPSVEFLANRLLTEIAAAPGCACQPPPQAVGGPSHWGPHAAAKQFLEAAMASQVELLNARPAGPAKGALALTSGGRGPEVNIQAILAEAEPEEDSDMDDDNDDDDCAASGDDEGYGEEGGEEEDALEESEEEGMEEG